MVQVGLVRSVGRSRWRETCRGRRRRWVLSDGYDATHLTGEVNNHVPCDRLLNEADELRVMEGCWNKGERMSPRHDERERVVFIE